MAYLASKRAPRLLVRVFSGAAALIALAGPYQSQQALAAERWPARVTASYDVDFNGFNIGTFDFEASVHGKTYVLAGDAQISAFLGIIKWRGLTRTAGRVRGVAPRPKAYSFDYRSGDKGGFIKMGFKSNRVARVSAFPAAVASGTIPLKPKHLNRVLDPLSAVMAMTKVKGDDPCARRLPIFDGKQRFDLILSYAGRRQIRSSGRNMMGYVCSVRYRPIAGYQPNAQTQKMANSDGLKIILQPISSARLLVPYQIVIPTIAGSVTITSKRITVSTATENIALVN